uniref:Predicted 23S rRNA methylase containing THUMP domain (ISS) putative n=1 Tax=Albugo laibachii Nc14 TaxID=890382 RepID=F0W5H7_9STRA|nr:Predicted 23S rRNA methylase containing THUMP domain (ISS) putative [Albugo laibachii Nc14]|eukprot:CCA16368.1 Predicted 23S rRNA methylase containing THUMP domain (ISS) putative [Albugo laibachii Nc14]
MVIPSTPCVALHVGYTHVERYEEEVRAFLPDATIVSVAPILYIQRLSLCNKRLYQLLALQFGAGRMKAHRIYRLDHCCNHSEWIIRCLESNRRELNAVRIVGFPQMLQKALKQELLHQGFTLNPTRPSHMLDAVFQVENANYIYFGIREMSLVPLPSPLSSTPIQKIVPCRAYYKLQECLDIVHVNADDRVLDIGAAPGGWTRCLYERGACVTAVDPGELNIQVQPPRIQHLQMLLEDALPQLSKMQKFDVCVCDINVRVHQSASLMLKVASLLAPSAFLVLTLKLGKKPNENAVQEAISIAERILSEHYHAFETKWLQANTRNERTLFARRKPPALSVKRPTETNLGDRSKTEFRGSDPRNIYSPTLHQYKLNSWSASTGNEKVVSTP